MRTLLLALALVATALAAPVEARDVPVDACSTAPVVRSDCDGIVCASSDLVPWAGGCVGPIDCRKIFICQPCTCPPLAIEILDPRGIVALPALP